MKQYVLLTMRCREIIILKSLRKRKDIIVYSLEKFLLTVLTMLSSTEYLEATLLPLIESIQPKTTDSFILEACGLEARPSTQSVSITIGARLEKFWNQVLSDMDNTTNMIEQSDRVDVNGRTRQIDHFFTIPDLMYASHMYLESKCNVNFDTEKVRASNQKIHDIANALEEQHDIINVQSGYFVPVKRDIPVEIAREYTNLGICIFGVSDLYRWFNDELPFTIDEYFEFFKYRLAPIIDALLDGRPISKVSHGATQKDMDLL